MKYVIIGNSAGGISGAQAIRQYDRTGDITIISEEGAFPYCRCLASYLLAGTLTEQETRFCSEDIYEKLRLEFIHRKVTGLNVKDQHVELDSGETIYYDRLLIASGSSPVIPSINGIDKKGVYPLRTLQHAKEMLSRLQKVNHVVVIGGGLVSLKAAAAFVKQGLSVSVVIRSKQVLSRMLDETSANICRRALEKTGINFYFDEDAVSIQHGRDNEVSGAVLGGGKELRCELILYGKGVIPNTQFLPVKDFALTPGAGLSADNYMETSIKGIFAAGDVVQTYDLAWQDFRINALWPNAREQGKIAGANMTGQRIKYSGSLGMNAVDFPGFRVIAAGITRMEPEDCSVSIIKSSGEEYRKLIFRGEQLAGYILAGPEVLTQAGYLTQLIRSGQPVNLKHDNTASALAKMRIRSYKPA